MIDAGHFVQLYGQHHFKKKNHVIPDNILLYYKPHVVNDKYFKVIKELI